jgi:hypothetical protein
VAPAGRVKALARAESVKNEIMVLACILGENVLSREYFEWSCKCYGMNAMLGEVKIL